MLKELWPSPLSAFANTAGQVFLIVLPLLVAVAYLTLVERKVIAFMQLRRGPNRVGPFGLFQPVADGLKLMHKEFLIPATATPLLFILAPLLTFTVSLAAWGVIPWGEERVFSNLNLGVVYLLLLSSLGVHGVILAGWASRSRYAFLGALRAVAQMLSYEVSLALTLVPIILSAGSLNLTAIVQAQQGLWYIFPHAPLAILFFINALAETRRAPFDLPEAESELVSGYHVEYASMGFSLLFLSEYANTLLMSSLGVLLFLGGWLPPLNCFPFTSIPGSVWMGLKISLVLFLFLWVRATLPRFRYDKLMKLGWKVCLPVALLWIVLTASFLLFWGGGTAS